MMVRIGIVRARSPLAFDSGKIWKVYVCIILILSSTPCKDTESLQKP